MLAIILLAQTLTLSVSGPPTSPEYLPLRVAEAEGLFSREGLSITLRTTRAEVGAAEALAQGQVDLAATSLEAMLRFGPRTEKQQSRVVFGLTAGPPVAVLASTALEGTIRSVQNLVGLKIGMTAPGGPEHTWFGGLLSRAGVRITQVELVSLGTRGLVAAVEAGDVQAGLVPEPYASRLVAEGRARMLADLRTPDGVKQALGIPTLNAAVFLRADRRPADRDLVAFSRAMLAAERRIATAPPEVLAEHLPRGVVGIQDEFERKLDTVRAVYLPDGVVSPEQIRESIGLIRAHLALPPTLWLGPPDTMLHSAPLKRAIQTPAR
jgi:NitT/TauT family transport system substrate-binding protein